MYNHNQSRSNTKPKSSGTTNHTNFIEALKANGGSIAKQTVTSLKDDLLLGTGKQLVDSIFNTNQFGSSPNQNSENPFDFNEFINSGREEQRAFDRVQYEYQQQETVIFNRRQDEIDKKIQEIKVELKRIKMELSTIDQGVQTVIDQEEVNPGAYHLNFLEKLLKFLRNMRIRVAKARNWSIMNQERNRAKSFFWQQASSKVCGTKFLLSQERTLATQTG